MAPRPVLLLLLALTCALGVVSMCLGINALVKSINEKAKVSDVAPPGVKIDIDDSDVVAVGAVLTVGCGFLGLACFLSLLLDIFKRPTRPRLQGAIIGFLTFWILATVIPTLILARTREADVSAFLGGAKIPDVLVQAAERGVSPVISTADEPCASSADRIHLPLGHLHLRRDYLHCPSHDQLARHHHARAVRRETRRDAY